MESCSRVRYFTPNRSACLVLKWEIAEGAIPPDLHLIAVWRLSGPARNRFKCHRHKQSSTRYIYMDEYVQCTRTANVLPPCVYVVIGIHPSLEQNLDRKQTPHDVHLLYTLLHDIYTCTLLPPCTLSWFHTTGWIGTNSSKTESHVLDIYNRCLHLNLASTCSSCY